MCGRRKIHVPPYIGNLRRRGKHLIVSLTGFPPGPPCDSHKVGHWTPDDAGSISAFKGRSAAPRPRRRSRARPACGRRLRISKQTSTPAPIDRNGVLILICLTIFALDWVNKKAHGLRDPGFAESQVIHHCAARRDLCQRVQRQSQCTRDTRAASQAAYDSVHRSNTRQKSADAASGFPMRALIAADRETG